MITKEVKFKDYNGVEKTKSYRFNLSPAELLEMELDKNGTLEEYVQAIVDSKDSKQIKDLFKEILLMSYGEKSLDGEYFEKSDELKKKFVASPAYSIIFTELATNTQAAVDFVNGITPSEEEMAVIAEQIKKNNN